MSAAEIAAEIPKLSPVERREIARLIFDLEEDRRTLDDCDQTAAENFRMLDRMEASDAATKPR